MTAEEELLELVCGGHILPANLILQQAKSSSLDIETLGCHPLSVLRD